MPPGQRLSYHIEKMIDPFYTKKFLDSINKNFRDINAIDIQYYLSEYEAIHKVSRRSLDNIRKGINGVFLWLEEQEYIEKNPFRKIRPIAYEQKPIQVLSELDIVRIRDWCHGKPRDMAMIEFLLSTGVRVSELCRVNISDVNLDSGEVTIQCAKKRMKKTRTCFLTMEAVYYIKAYLQWRNDKRYTSSEALFQSNRTCGMRVTERIVNNFLRSMEKSLDLSLPLTVHVFRKTLASRLFAKGMDGKSIATILGHASSSTSERYYIGVQTANLKHEFEKYS